MYHLCELLYTHAFRAIIKLLVFGVGENGGCCVVLAVLGHFALEGVQACFPSILRWECESWRRWSFGLRKAVNAVEVTSKCC